MKKKFKKAVLLLRIWIGIIFPDPHKNEAKTGLVNKKPPKHKMKTKNEKF
jgi:hypothetical protein